MKRWKQAMDASGSEMTHSIAISFAMHSHFCMDYWTAAVASCQWAVNCSRTYLANVEVFNFQLAAVDVFGKVADCNSHARKTKWYSPKLMDVLITLVTTEQSFAVYMYKSDSNIQRRA